MAHPQPNFNRMLQLIDEVFATRKDPGQIQVTPQQLKKLQAIHPATLSELSDKNGPLIWVLMIPTSTAIMNKFLARELSEKQLLTKTKPGTNYDCIYLCSVTTLPEQRGKGETLKLCLKAIQSIRENHPITTLFVWPFSKGGEALAEKLAKACHMALLKRGDFGNAVKK